MEEDNKIGGRERTTVRDVLFEVRHHAKGTISQDQDDRHRTAGGGTGGGWLSWISARGEKLDQLKFPRQSGKKVSLFVSPDGSHVAVATVNQITILHKDDDYIEPCGLFVCADKSTTFAYGAWSRTSNILGVANDTSVFYLIKSNGEEILRRTRKQLKLSSPIAGLVALDGLSSESSCLNGFYIFSANEIVCLSDLTDDPCTSIHVVQMSSNHLMAMNKFPKNVLCLDFHPDFNLFVLFCASLDTSDLTGLPSLYLLHMTSTFELEILFCSFQLEGTFSLPKGYAGIRTFPKVLISPLGKHIATLDLVGCLHVYNLNSKMGSPLLSSGVTISSSSEGMVLQRVNYFKDIGDVCWWEDHILIVATMSGGVLMYDILGGVKVMERDPVCCLTAIERVNERIGYSFILEATLPCWRGKNTPQFKESTEHTDSLSFLSGKQMDLGDFSWSLISFSQMSLSEMYSSLISKADYEDAMKLADQYGLDTDDVFKTQWMLSEQGKHEIETILRNVKDENFILSECINKVGSTEDAVKALISHGLYITDKYIFSEFDDGECSSIWEFRMVRLQLLQYRDRLETFVGINMGRFSSQEYCKFRFMPLKEAALTLAESGKIGALNLLFKRHTYSLAPHILEVLSSIPETVPVGSYGQLLPGKAPPSTTSLRCDDWVECKSAVAFINKMQRRPEEIMWLSTENILKLSMGLVWPSVDELSTWYKCRARDIDNLSGQIDSCISLIEFACRKGILELKKFLDDVSYFHGLVYSGSYDEDWKLSLAAWEDLSDYEKFKMLLKGVQVEQLVETLRMRAIPFMDSRFRYEAFDSEEFAKEDAHLVCAKQGGSFLVRWLKECATENKLDICSVAIECGCGESKIDGFFKTEAEVTETALDCIYLCTLLDQWNKMTSILLKLPHRNSRDKPSATSNDCSLRHNVGTPRFSYSYSPFSKLERHLSSGGFNEVESELELAGSTEQVNVYTVENKLGKRIKTAEGHVEAGRILEYYQVPRPVSFFLSAHSDEKNVKQLLRLILSKFARRQPVKSDNDWATLWHDIQCLREKAFPFLDVEFVLSEFCRGLLKAGKFSFARNYLKGTGSTVLGTEKAENLVIQAAREYFFSASSLACIEIWNAKECLSIFPTSKNVQGEADVIDALTVRLPSLGVTLLPMQFKQIRNPMEVINMVISSHTGAYLNVEELVEIAKLLGLSSPEDICAVEEAVAREAAVDGDLQLAFDLCLVLATKGHGPIWDLCAAIARGPQLENMNANSRKHLLGFALSNCDDESIIDLLRAWKDVDLLCQYDNLINSTGSNLPNFTVQESSIISLPMPSADDLRESSEYGTGLVSRICSDDGVYFKNIEVELENVGKLIPELGIYDGHHLVENKKLLAFSGLELPWLLQLSESKEYGKRMTLGAKSSCLIHCLPIKVQALVAILYWLTENDIVPNDDVIISLADCLMEHPVVEEDDILGCSILLNLIHPLRGVEVIEKQLKTREVYQEIYNIMSIGMTYSSVNNECVDCSTSDARRKLLLNKFQEKNTLTSDDISQIDKLHSTFWREWTTKLEEQKRLADQARVLEQIIPGIETSRFLSGDIEYIRSMIFSFIESIKFVKRNILREAVILADTYGVRRIEVLLHFFGCALVSEHWENDDILSEVSEFREDIVNCPRGVINVITSAVYPVIKGHNKLRLSYIYSILSACYLRIRKTEEPLPLLHRDSPHLHTLQLDEYYKVLEQECRRISFIEELNFKNIAGLNDVDFEHFKEEICINICEYTVESLADVVRNLTGMYSDPLVVGLMTWQDVYKHHVLHVLASLEDEGKSISLNGTAEDMGYLIGKILRDYDVCKKNFRFLIEDQADIKGRFLMLSISCFSHGCLMDESSRKNNLIAFLNFLSLVVDTNKDNYALQERSSRILLGYLDAFSRLVMNDEVLVSQGWSIMSNFVAVNPVVDVGTDTLQFCKAMVLSGCDFKFIALVFAEAEVSSSSPHDGKLGNLVGIFSAMMSEFLLDPSEVSKNKHNLLLLLSSLSKCDGNYIEVLRAVRYEIWGRLLAISNDMQLDSHVRLFALEFMQAITGRNLRNFPVEVTQVEPWEAWDEFGSIKASLGDSSIDLTSSVTSNLISLRSNQLLSAISPNIKITSDDLVTISSAVSCFFKLSEAATSLSHIHVLKDLLNEWELFTKQLEEEKGTEKLEDLNDWNNDEWDEGWERLPEEPLKLDGQDASVSIHPLHACWMEIIRRLVACSKIDSVVELLDQSLLKPYGILVDEDEVEKLFQLVFGINYMAALKIVLLLPFDGPRTICLQMVESELQKDGFVTAPSVDEYELVVLVLLSGAVNKIVINPAFGNVFSYLCYVVGRLARFSQEELLRCRIDGSGVNLDKYLIFCKIIFPIFISELVMTGQLLLAALMVSQWMHMPVSFHLINVADASLKMFLQGQLTQEQQANAWKPLPPSFGSLQYSISSLKDKLGSLLQSALSSLTVDIE